ncbi:NAD(P)-dependent oxidoreductase [Solimicrobium silvestre]|uniref:3-hydroxyisobutyrate dehydrogenase and related beta-hydroxyacid dehydrogenase n=1 Tax=Solimicrobium silvestre TaxID=2099400 RepID=A0A2S9GV97_9BURK|nr:NAD(P)-dependent oxidoreductase [Solimicrobium silvestre]PRC91631.1 3-hydroxyisobutyrate dehydrogenase and related beta-hydroxyacid dehydrogenase [Solimicrobium silvestre]
MKNSAALPHIAFLGLGLMGQPMACRLLQAGYPLTVWNRTAAKAAVCVAQGATLAETIPEAVRSAAIVITMLEAGPVVKQVLNQALDALADEVLVIDMSSTQQLEALELHQLLAARGVGFIDAPVSGGVIGAEAGSLAIMVGASELDYLRVKPILEVMGKPTLVGAPGSGQLAKLCNQLIVGGTLILVAEALLLAQAGGADPAAVRQALRGGFAESKILEVHGQRMLDRNFMPGGQVRSQAKDMENILLAAQQAQLKLPQAELIAQVYRHLLITNPQADHSAALLELENNNSGIRLGQKPDQLPV